MHAGFGAFRGAVLLRPPIHAALRRHTRRAAASVMAHGGFTAESGRLMQQILDLQGVLTALDGACAERGTSALPDASPASASCAGEGVPCQRCARLPP